MLSYIVSSPLPTIFSLEKPKAVLIFRLKFLIEIQENLQRKRKCAGKSEYIHDDKILSRKIGCYDERRDAPCIFTAKSAKKNIPSAR